MKLFWYLFLVVIIPTFIFPQIYLGNYTSHVSGGNSVKVFAGETSLKFVFYRSDILRVDFLPTLTTELDSSFVIIRDTTESVAVIINDFSDSLIISSSEIMIVCQKFPLRIEYFNSTHSLLLSEPSSGGIATNGNDRIVNFMLNDEDHFYGTGERGTSLDKKGQSFSSYNTQFGGYTSALPTMNINIPFLANKKGYALYFENTYPGNFDLGKTNPNKFSYTASGGELSYFLIVAGNVPLQLEKYTWLTGRQPLPPRWAFGFIQSKFGYENEAEARFTVQTLRQRKIPSDAIILDLFWFQNMGDISWDFTQWGDPFQMMTDFLDDGMKTIVITEPYIVEYSTNFQPAVSNNFLASNSSGDPYLLSGWWSCNCSAGLLDLTNPLARQWWWDKHPNFFGDELSGIWTDLGEPENHPEGMIHFLGSRNKVHNIYNLFWAETIFNGFNQFRPNQRIFNLTRSGYAGIQRYGVIPWSGDVGRSFGGLEVQLPMLLNMGMSGLGYHNSDIGGFCCGFTTPELYVRWMQNGTFCPITRAHGVGQPTEPWGYGDEAENISQKYIDLRYQLLPYIYTMAYQNYKTGMPLARPLFFDHPQNGFLDNYSMSYMWGDALLVSPVVSEGAQTKDVFLPEGNWINFWNDQVYAGGENYIVSAPLDVLPIFIKEGSVIPMQPVMQYTDEIPLDTLILVIYPSPGKAAEFLLYEDDGTTLEYQSGSYATTNIKQFFTGNSLLEFNIGASTGNFQGKLTNRTYLTEVHLIGNAPTGVFKNGFPVTLRSSYQDLRSNSEGYFYDGNVKLLYVQITGSTDSTYQVTGEGIVLSAGENIHGYPENFVLKQNFPNPFNSTTTIRYELPESANVTLRVYSILGEEVASLVDEQQEAGRYEVQFSAIGGSASGGNASSLASGIYIYRIVTGDFVASKKLILMK